MLYKEGYVYHIKDEYFEKVNDDMLMQNKENGTYRPTFYCLKDEKTSLLWMVPLSSRVDKFRAIHDKQAKNDPKNANKPDNIIAKMIEGRLKKEMKEFCLVDQPYVKDGDLTVQKYIDSVAKEIGADIQITRYVRFETGEGLEKKDENFAEEVAKAMN